MSEHSQRVISLTGDIASGAAVLGTLAGMDVAVASPEGYALTESDVALAAATASHPASLSLHDDPREAVAGAVAVYTDVWVSRGKEQESAQRISQLQGYQINGDLCKLAPGALVMHCLPAYRGKEIDAETFEANADTIFRQAENRLHAQKAILSLLVK